VAGLFFPQSFDFYLSILVFADLFQFFLFHSAVSWDCHVNYPYLLLLNHSDVWYVVRQVFVSLYLEVPENFNVLFLKNLIDFVLPPFVSCW
jgi:hypothetical protein